MKLVNLQEFPSAQTLFQEEIDVIKYAIETAVANSLLKVELGTFILDGRSHGGEAQCILRGNFGAGPYERTFLTGDKVTSDWLAETAIDELLEVPIRSRYGVVRMTGPDEQISTSIHESDELSVLVVNADYGQFIFSAYPKCSSGEEDGRIPREDVRMSKAVMTAVWMALASIGKAWDVALMDAQRALFNYLDQIEEDSAGVLCAWTTGLIAGSFNSAADSAIKVWQTWSGTYKVNGSGRRKDFFIP